MRIWVLVEHLITARRSLAEYIEDSGQLWIDGALAPLRLYWCVQRYGPVQREPAWQDLYGYDPADADLAGAILKTTS